MPFGEIDRLRDDEPEKVDFVTNTVLLDMRGGDRLPGKDRELKTPGEMLLLDPDGILVVRNELDDLVEVETRIATITPQEGPQRDFSPEGMELLGPPGIDPMGPGGGPADGARPGGRKPRGARTRRGAARGAPGADMMDLMPGAPPARRGGRARNR